MRSPVKTSSLFPIEPHHRPLVWAGGAAFFGFPLLQRALERNSWEASTVWLVPAVICGGVGITLLLERRRRPIVIVLFALGLGWFLAGSAALTIQHQDAHDRPIIPAGLGGVIRGTVTADSREGRGTVVILPLRLEGYTSEVGIDSAASGELLLRLRGGAPVARGSALSLRLNGEEIAAVAGGRRSLSVERSQVILTPPKAGAAKLRGRIRREIIASLRRMGEPAGGLGRALLLGDRSAVDPGFLESVRRAGATHLLALSGVHLAVLAGLLGLLLFPLLGRIAGAVSTVLLAFYFWVVGPIPSLLRALLMFGFGTAAKLAGRRVDPRSLLAAAVLVAFLAVPDLATTLGWRLSTVALIGILWIGAPLWARGPALPPNWLWSLLWVSFGAFVATTPISLSTFGEAYPASILSSLFLTPLVLLFILIALISLPLLSITPLLTLPLGGASGGLYALLEGGAAVLGRFRPLSGSQGELIWTMTLAAVLVALPAPWLRYVCRSWRNSASLGDPRAPHE